MKKVIILLGLVLVISGCNNRQENENNHDAQIDTVEEVIEEKYEDENDTKIGIYKQRANRLELLNEYQTSITSGVDIGIFEIYPSNDDEVIMNSDFGTSFYNAWTSLDNYNNLKIGFNLKYTLSSGEEISYNILDYNVIYKEIYNYLYDDYANRYNSWYSHIEESDYTSNTLFTSIKLYSASVDDINSKIVFTVFTYDDLDDFDENNEYRGNSSYSITICDINKTC